MKLVIRSVFLPIFFVLISALLVGCNSQGSMQPTDLPVVHEEQNSNLPTATAIPPTKELPTATIAPTGTPSFISTVQYLQIYRMPHLKSAIRDDIRDRETFQVTGKSADGKFIQIEYDGKVGWVDAQYIAGSTKDAIQKLPVMNFQGVPTEMLNWKGSPIKTLCFESNAKFVGDYSRNNPDEVPTPYSEGVLQVLLKSLGVDLVQAGETCDATLKFEFVIDQQGGRYTNQNTGEKAFCYTGLNLTNRWSLAQGDIVVKGEEKSSRSTKEEMIGCWQSSPYQDEQLYTSFAVIQRFWGDAVYPPLAEIVETAANRYVIKSADKLGKKGMFLVPLLIDFTDDFILGSEVQDVLKKITGQQFYEDQAAWMEWYSSIPTSTPIP